MRVLHVPYTYFPDPVGGTEVYVAQLARELRALGIESLVAAPGEAAAEYTHEGTPVLRYRVGPVGDVAELHDAAPGPWVVAALDALVAAARPDVLHLHAYTRGVPFEATQIGRTRQIAVVVTYHSPSLTCPIGTLIRDGEVICDGALDVGRCAHSVARAHGASRATAAAIARLPTAVGRVVGRLAPRAGGAATALRTTRLMQLRHERVEHHLALADAVVAPSRWVRDLLVRIGVPDGKILVSPQGIDASAVPLRTRRDADRAVQLVLVGRYSPVKGMHVVVDALRQIPDAPVVLDTFGSAQDEGAHRYRRALEERAARDPRIRFHDELERAKLADVLAGADAVLVPSLWLETGPLTVLEAQAAGVPVIGSNLGGIPDRVRDGIDGLLVTPGDTSAWATTIERFAREPELRARLAGGVRPPRSMGEVAREMARLYIEVTSRRAMPAEMVAS